MSASAEILKKQAAIKLPSGTTEIINPDTGIQIVATVMAQLAEFKYGNLDHISEEAGKAIDDSMRITLLRMLEAIEYIGTKAKQLDDVKSAKGHRKVMFSPLSRADCIELGYGANAVDGEMSYVLQAHRDGTCVSWVIMNPREVNNLIGSMRELLSETCAGMTNEPGNA